MPSALVATSALSRPAEQVLLEGQPFGGLGLAGVRRDGVALRTQVLGDLLGRGDGERVDDPGAVEVAEVLAQPGQPLLGSLELEHAELERLAVERAAEHQHVSSVPSCSATSAVTRALAVAVVASTGMPSAAAS